MPMYGVKSCLLHWIADIGAMLCHTCAAGEWRVRPGTKAESEKSPHSGQKMSVVGLAWSPQLPGPGLALCSTMLPMRSPGKDHQIYIQQHAGAVQVRLGIAVLSLHPQQYAMQPWRLFQAWQVPTHA
jgi:hypothetical protein